VSRKIWQTCNGSGSTWTLKRFLTIEILKLRRRILYFQKHTVLLGTYELLRVSLAMSADAIAMIFGPFWLPCIPYLFLDIHVPASHQKAAV
jgi:hypothetical protein